MKPLFPRAPGPTLRRNGPRLPAAVWPHLCACCLPLTLLLAPVASAQESVQEPLRDSVQGNRLEEVQVIGRREANSAGQRSPSALSIDSQTQLSLARSPGDWLEALPGVSLNGQGGLLQAYSVRGFSRARVRTEVDGVPILTDRRAGNSASFLPPQLLGDAVVERSAVSSLYGSGAMGGVVSLNTLRPQALAVEVDGRNNDRQRSLALVGGGDALAGGLVLRRADDAESADGQPLNTRYQQFAGLLRGRYTLGDQELEFSWVPSSGDDIGRSNALYPDGRRSTTPYERHSVARVELRADGDWFLRAYHHYQNWATDVERVAERRNRTDYQSHTLGGLLYARTAVLGGNGAVGAEWVGRRGVEIREREAPVGEPLPTAQTVVDGEEDTLGLFAEQSWSRGATELRGGLRVDRITQSSDTRQRNDLRWSGSLRLEQDVAEAWSASAEVASAYRFPSLGERYFNGQTPRGEVRGNPDLAPETRDSFELALRYEPTAQPLSLSLAAYHSELNDYIERITLAPQILTFRNVEQARMTGLEAEAAFSVGALTHRLSYQWQEGEDRDGGTLADLNPAEWRYFLAYEGGRYALRSDLRYRPSRSEAGPGELPLAAATLWSLTLGRDFARRWQGEVYMSNLLDEEFRSSADDLAPLQPGRTIGVRLRWSRS